MKETIFTNIYIYINDVRLFEFRRRENKKTTQHNTFCFHYSIGNRKIGYIGFDFVLV